MASSDLQQAVAADAVPLVAGLPGRQVPDVGDVFVPADGAPLDGARRLGVVCVEPSSSPRHQMTPQP
ncbi:hypothetical protein AQJ91_43450 [Streptomyces dysideae]|uniref:Uncharacterized protein n=1 Tax=Streptomyces dysideae TaxID=909626 RepID=A0A101UQN9_9ACTN|nr:hypothetical protein AQJ91_43450 [Streptomyces dysideae]